MKYLLLSSLLLLVIGSASAQTPIKDTCTVNLFQDTVTPYLYHTKIHLFGHDFSGLMMLKNMGNNNYKVAITTTFGVTILSFEMKDNKFVLNDCIRQMKRKQILKMIGNDMNLLLDKKPVANTKNAFNVVEVNGYHATPLRKYGYEGTCEGPMTYADAYRHKKKKVSIQFTDYVDKTPNKINVQHLDMPVKLEMERLVDSK